MFNVTLGSGLRTIGEDAFYECDLQYLNITDIASWCAVEFYNDDSIYAMPHCIAGNIYLNGYVITDLVIPEGVNQINYACFAYCDSITSVTLPSSLQTIATAAFGECDSLQAVNFAPSGLNTIGERAFFGCDSLSLVEIPAGVTQIGEAAFARCDSLASVAIPSTVTNMYNDVFNSCNNLTIFTTLSYAPNDWNSGWNSSNRPVIWNWTGAEVTYTLMSNGAPIGTVSGRYSVELPTYEMAGYVHVGWYNNQFNNGTLYTDVYYDAVNTTLYAYWMTEEEYNILMSDGTSFERAKLAYAGNSYYIDIAQTGQEIYYKIIPTETRYYTIESGNNSNDPKVYIYNSSYEQITSDDDGSNNGNNFYVYIELEAGETYYIKASSYNGGQGNYYMYIQ